MSAKTAISLIVMSALISGILYGWRWIAGGPSTTTEGLSLSKAIGFGSLVSPEGFLVAWGAVFLILSMLATAAPTLAGAMALLILLGQLLANFSSVAHNATQLIAQKSSNIPRKAK